MCCNSGGSAPAPSAPDYATLIPLQERSNLNQFNAMLGAQRTNSITPFGRQTWYRPGEQVQGGYPQTSTVDPRSVGGRSQAPNPGAGGGWRGPTPTPGGGMRTPPMDGGGVAPPMYGSPGGTAPAPGPGGGIMGTHEYRGPRSMGGEPRAQVSYGEMGGPASMPPGYGSDQQVGRFGGQQELSNCGGGGDGDGPNPMPGRGNPYAPEGGGQQGPSMPGQQPPPGGPSPLEQAANQGPWTMVQELDPREQWLRDQDLRVRAGQGDISEGMLGNVQQEYSNPARFAGQMRQYGDDYFAGSDRNRTEDSLYNRQMRFMEPKMQQAESRLHQRLASQGFDTRGDAYNEQMQNLGEQQNTMRADATDRSIVGAGQESSAELARLLQRANFGQGQSLQSINLQQQDRGRLLNELNAFRTGQQVNLPNVSPTTQTPNLQGTDHLGLAQQNYSNQMGQWNAGQASQDNMLGGLMGLAGRALGGPLGGMLGTAMGGQMPPRR